MVRQVLRITRKLQMEGFLTRWLGSPRTSSSPSASPSASDDPDKVVGESKDKFKSKCKW